MNEDNAPTIGYGLDQELPELPPGLSAINLSSANNLSGKRQTERAAPAGQDIPGYFAEHDRFQNYGGVSSTNAVDADPYLYYTSDQQLAMPSERTASYRLKKSDFTTDHLDPRMPEGMANLLPQWLRVGMGPEQDQAVDRQFRAMDLLSNADAGTMNTIHDGDNGAPMSAKEAVYRGVQAAAAFYGVR